MKEKRKFFREALEKYYKTSFKKRKDTVEPNFVDKVNDCIISVLKNIDGEVEQPIDLESTGLIEPIKPIKPNDPTNSVIVLPNGCYTKMLESDDLELYSKCLSQFGELPIQQIELIKRCVRGEKFESCYLNPTVDFETIGEYRYTDCCGSMIIEFTDKTGLTQINSCVTKNTIETYDKGGKGAIIKSVDYGNGSCLCDKKVTQ
jgi:hypothetical protein